MLTFMKNLVASRSGCNQACFYFVSFCALRHIKQISPLTFFNFFLVLEKPAQVLRFIPLAIASTR